VTDGRKSWQEPMVWLMIGIPAATVIAGLATLAIAIRSGAMDTVPSSVQRVAQAQVLTSAVDDSTSRMGYRGYLMLDRKQPAWRVSVKTVPADLAGTPLQVLFVHPTLAARDVRVDLGAGHVAAAVMLGFIPQQVIVSDAAGTWRLVGAYSEQSVLNLTPALSAQ
jgi:uncharacterized protein